MNLITSLEIATGINDESNNWDGLIEWHASMKEVIEDKLMSVKVLEDVAHQCGYKLWEFIKLGCDNNET